MFSWGAVAKLGLSIVDKVLGLWRGKQEADERQEYRKAGRDEQKVADHEGQAESVAKGKQAAHRVVTDSGFRDRVRRFATRSGDK